MLANFVDRTTSLVMYLPRAYEVLPLWDQIHAHDLLYFWQIGWWDRNSEQHNNRCNFCSSSYLPYMYKPSAVVVCIRMLNWEFDVLNASIDSGKTFRTFILNRVFLCWLWGKEDNLCYGCPQFIFNEVKHPI
jgi:hypothetical protein